MCGSLLDIFTLTAKGNSSVPLKAKGNLSKQIYLDWSFVQRSGHCTRYTVDIPKTACGMKGIIGQIERMLVELERNKDHLTSFRMEYERP